MIILKSPEEIDKIRSAAKIVAEIISEVGSIIRPGVTTWDLDQLAEELMRKKKVIPSFKGYRGYPNVLCLSKNEVIVHGIPSKKVVLNEGDIIGVDCGVIFEGFHGDSARTFPVGKVSPQVQKLLEVSERSLMSGIEQMQVGNRIQDIGAAVQKVAESGGYSVVKEFVGHGIGRSLHEDPQVPNYGKAGTGIRLVPGLVLAIEPMVNMGTEDVKILKDGWTAVTVDGRWSAHFEHTVALTENGHEILSVL